MNYFSPINSRYAPPQLESYTVTNEKQPTDPQFRSQVVPGPFVQSRPTSPINIANSGLAISVPDLPPNRTLLSPERETVVNGLNQAIERIGKHHTLTDYYSQGTNGKGYLYSPYYRLSDNRSAIPEYMVVDTRGLVSGYSLTYGGIAVTIAFNPLHIGKLLFRRFDGDGYILNGPSGTGGFLGTGPGGIYQNLPSAALAYCLSYRPVYNITERVGLPEPYLSNATCFLRFSPAWLEHEFFPSGGGTSFNGTLTSPTWHIGMPSVTPIGPTTFQLTVRVIDTSDGTFTLTIDFIESDPIEVDTGAGLASGIATALDAVGIPIAFINITVVDTTVINNYLQTILDIEFDNSVGSPFYEREIPIEIDTALAVDTTIFGYFTQLSTQPITTDLLYFAPTDWYSYLPDGPMRERRKWYSFIPGIVEIDPTLPRSGLNVFSGMDSQGRMDTLGTMSLSGETPFSLVSWEWYPDYAPAFVVPIETTPNAVAATLKKIKVSPAVM